MPMFYIPPLGEKIKLTQDWTFTLYKEYRNDGLAKALGLLQPKADGSYDWGRYNRRGEKIWGQVTLPAGSVLTMSRIYVRQGAKDFDSVTFILSKKDCPDEKIRKSKNTGQLRFWVKLHEVNGTFFNVVDYAE